MLGISYYTYRKAFFNGKITPSTDIPDGWFYKAYREPILELINTLAAAPYEEVSIRSRDNLLLKGRYYHHADNAPVVMMVHGYRSGGVRDSGGGYRLAKALGLNVLIIEQRGCGISEGKAMTFGALEKRDGMDWVNYLTERFPDSKILLYGVSLGAATVLLMGEQDLPKQVCAILADSAYTSGEDIIAKVCRDMHLPGKLAMPFVRLGARLWGHFSLKDADVTEAVKHITLPVLFLHGEGDTYVPCEMSRINYEACGSADKQILTVPKADHAMSFFADNETYCRVVTEFIRKHI